MKDVMGKEFRAGDWIAYPTRQGSSMETVIGYVRAVVKAPTYYGVRGCLEVLPIRGTRRMDGPVYRGNQVQVTETYRAVRLNSADVPQHYRTLIFPEN